MLVLKVDAAHQLFFLPYTFYIIPFSWEFEPAFFERCQSKLSCDVAEVFSNGEDPLKAVWHTIYPFLNETSACPAMYASILCGEVFILKIVVNLVDELPALHRIFGVPINFTGDDTSL